MSIFQTATREERSTFYTEYINMSLASNSGDASRHGAVIIMELIAESSQLIARIATLQTSETNFPQQIKIKLVSFTTHRNYF